MGECVKLEQVELVNRLKQVKAKDIMTKSVISTTQETTLAELSKVMTEKRISGMPVMSKEGKITGVVTTTDLFTVMGMIKFGDVVEDGKMAVSNPTVKFAMSNAIITVGEETNLSEIIDIMKGKGLHTLPVVDSNNNLSGIIGRHDVFKNFYAILRDVTSR